MRRRSSRWLVLMIAACAALSFVAPSWLLIWALLAVLCVVKVGFVLAGRNPWRMQGYLDRRRVARR
jgi:hypothetical protein